jgi:hypothetical protein
VPRTVPIEEPQPSQLYLNGRKLALATEWFDFGKPNYDPIPVVRLDGKLVLTDGHTRAFLASVAGAERLRVRRDRDDLPLDVYRECVAWCESGGITTVADLHGRAVDADTFEAEWVQRCRAVADDSG